MFNYMAPSCFRLVNDCPCVLYLCISSARRSKFIYVFDIYVPTYVGLDVFHAPVCLVPASASKHTERREKCVHKSYKCACMVVTHISTFL